MTKERLEELIRQGGTVYKHNGDEIQLINSKETRYNISDSGYLHIACLANFMYHGNDRWIDVYIEPDKLYETKEQAEWELEFGDVTRTEKLELPTWERMQEIERFDFKGKDGHTYRMYFMSGFRTLAVVGIIKNEYYGEATYENYLEACRICKKLFLGEEL